MWLIASSVVADRQGHKRAGVIKKTIAIMKGKKAMKHFTLTAYGLYSPLDALGALTMAARRGQFSLRLLSGQATSSAWPTASDGLFNEKTEIDDVVSSILTKGIVEEKDGLRIILGKNGAPRPTLFIPCDVARFKAGLPQETDRLSIQIDGSSQMRGIILSHMKGYIGNEWTENGVDKAVISSNAGNHAYVYAPERLQFLARAASAIPQSDAKAVGSSLEFIKRFKPDYSLSAARLAMSVRNNAGKENDGSTSFVVDAGLTAEDIRDRLLDSGYIVDVVAQRKTGVGQGRFEDSAMFRIWRKRDNQPSYLGLNNVILMEQERAYVENQPNLFRGLSVLTFPSQDGQVVGCAKDVMKSLTKIPFLDIKGDSFTPMKSVTEPAVQRLAKVRGFAVDWKAAPDTVTPQGLYSGRDWMSAVLTPLVAPVSAFSAIASTATDEALLTQSDVVAYALKKAMPEAQITIHRDPNGNASDDVVDVIESGKPKVSVTFGLANAQERDVCGDDRMFMSVVVPVSALLHSSDGVRKIMPLMHELFSAVPFSEAVKERKEEAKRSRKSSSPGHDMP